MRWAWRGGALAVLLLGWVFIASQNGFHISAPVVFVCLGYLAVVTTVYNLWHTGASAVAGPEDEGDSTWAKPTGARGELEREKRTLLKAIKEAEFDHQMGKLSQRDADEMIRGYRARAIEVIKEIDRLGLGAAASPREQIMREVRARIELDMKSSKKAAAKQGPKVAAAAATSPGKPDGQSEAKRDAKAASGKKQRAKVTGPAVVPFGHAVPGNPAVAVSAEDAELSELEDAGNEAASAGEPAMATAPAVDAEAAQTGTANANDKAAAAAQAALDDEAMDADSTTAVEPRRSDTAKEATP